MREPFCPVENDDQPQFTAVRKLDVQCFAVDGGRGQKVKPWRFISCWPATASIGETVRPPRAAGRLCTELAQIPYACRDLSARRIRKPKRTERHPCRKGKVARDSRLSLCWP